MKCGKIYNINKQKKLISGGHMAKQKQHPNFEPERFNPSYLEGLNDEQVGLRKEQGLSRCMLYERQFVQHRLHRQP